MGGLMPENKNSPLAEAAEQGSSGSVEQRQNRWIKAGALQTAILTSANFSIIALSANAMPSDIKRGLDAGFFNYLTKPLKIGEFLHGLDTALAFARKSA